MSEKKEQSLTSDENKKSILFIAGAGMDHRLVRAIKLPETNFNKPLIVDLPGHGDSKGSSSNSIESYSQFLIEAIDQYDLCLLYTSDAADEGLV